MINCTLSTEKLELVGKPDNCFIVEVRQRFPTSVVLSLFMLLDLMVSSGAVVSLLRTTTLVPTTNLLRGGVINCCPFLVLGKY